MEMETTITIKLLAVSLNYCSQNGGNLYRAPFYNRNPNIVPRIDSNLGQSPFRVQGLGVMGIQKTEAPYGISPPRTSAAIV